METIKLNYCDFFSLKDKGTGIVTTTSDNVIVVNERVSVIASDKYVGDDSLRPMDAVVKKVACISGFDIGGSGLYVLEISRL